MTFDHPALLALAALAPAAALGAARLSRAGALSRGRARMLGAAGAIAIAAAAVAAAGPRRGGPPGPALAAVIALDDSASMTEADLAAGKALLSTRSERVVGRLVFDGTVRPAPGAISKAAPADGSDIAGAIGAAEAILLAERAPSLARRIVVVSDGGATRGDPAALAGRLRGEGIAVDVVAAGAAPDVALTAIDAPAVIRGGEPAAVTVRVASSGDTRTTLVFSANGHEVSRREVELTAGERPVAFSWRPSAPGIVRLEVEIPGAADARPANDAIEARSEVLPPPATLLVSAGIESIATIDAAAGALSAAGIGVQRMAPGDLPTDPAALGGFELVVLDGVDADAIGVERIAALSAFVRAGGGLVALPGAKGLAKGSSVAAQALRRTLPLATVDDEKKEPPPVALVFILDRSDSMARERKWEVAARTTASAYGDMNPASSVGLITFSDFTDWVVPLSKVKDVPDFPKKVRAIRLAGGTDLFPALKESFRALGASQARLKHVVLLSDGVSTSRLEENAELVDSMSAARITVSTVAMGSEADQRTMSEIARRTGGRYWYVSNPDDLPRIFAEETKSSAKDDDLPDPIAGLELEKLPALASLDPAAGGWTPTTHARTRASADTVWQLDRPDDPQSPGSPRRPLLARARFGKGRAVALAAPLDAGALDAGKLAGGLARLALPEPGEPGDVVASAVADGGAARVTVSRVEPGILGDGWSVQVIGDQTARFPLAASGADRASAVVPLPDGAALARVLDPAGRPAAWVALPQPARRELLPVDGGAAALAALARATGGEVLAIGGAPAWLAAPVSQPGKPMSVPIGLVAMGAALGTVWARRPKRA